MKTRILNNPLEKSVLFVVLFVSALVLLFAFSPNKALAFSSENASVIRVNNNTWIYVNQAEYGNAQGETLVPIAAVPSWVPRMQGDYLKYQVQINEQTFAGLDTNALVLSDAAIKDNQYVIPPGEKRNVTLFAVITLPDREDINSGTTVGLEITDLPITLQTKFNIRL